MTVTAQQYEIIKRSYALIMFLLTPAAMIYSGYKNSSIFEMLFTMAAFLLLYRTYSEKIHPFGSKLICAIASVVIFSGLNSISFPIDISLICAPALGLITALISNKIAKEYQKKPKFRLVKGCSEKELREAAKIVKLSEFQILLLVDKYCNRIKFTNLEDKYNYSERRLRTFISEAENLISN
jgi:predicted membrane protein